MNPSLTPPSPCSDYIRPTSWGPAWALGGGRGSVELLPLEVSALAKNTQANFNTCAFHKRNFITEETRCRLEAKWTITNCSGAQLPCLCHGAADGWPYASTQRSSLENLPPTIQTSGKVRYTLFSSALTCSSLIPSLYQYMPKK